MQDTDWTWQELGWGTQAAADANGANVPTVLGFNSKGPFDAAGHPILSIIATNAGFNSDFYAFTAFICGQTAANSFGYVKWILCALQVLIASVQYSSILSASSPSNAPLCLTASALGVPNITLSLLPCVYVPLP